MVLLISFFFNCLYVALVFLFKYGLRLISQWAIRSSETILLANPDIANEFYEHPTRFKSIPMQLYTIHSECHHPTLGI